MANPDHDAISRLIAQQSSAPLHPARNHAVVIGAGIGGLAAAAALAPLFGRVTVFEKDALPDEAVPRKGVAQGQHVHVFLVGGLASLDQLFPDILKDFQTAGAERVELGQFDFFDFGSMRPHRDLGLHLYCLSRPAYEHIIRKRVMALSNVEIRTDSRIDRIEFDSGAATGLRVRGYPAPVTADLVVDASGRSASLVSQLTEQGYDEPPDVEIGIDVCYASARFRLHERWRGKSAALCMPVPPDKYYGIVLPIEGNQCIVTLGGRCGVAPGDELNEFLEYARKLACPAVYERLMDAEQMSPLRIYHKPSANWRRYEQMRQFPERVVPVGDTIASFNPTWGQGMTVAVRHALALRQAIEQCGIGPGLARIYLSAAAAASEEAWDGTALIDLAYPEVSGERPPDFEQSLAFMRGLRTLADADPSVHKLQYEVLQLARSSADLRDPNVAARVMALTE